MKNKLRVKTVKENGKDRYAVQKCVFSFLGKSLWKTMVDHKVSPPTPMVYKMAEKAYNRVKNLQA